MRMRAKEWAPVSRPRMHGRLSLSHFSGHVRAAGRYTLSEASKEELFLLSKSNSWIAVVRIGCPNRSVFQSTVGHTSA